MLRFVDSLGAPVDASEIDETTRMILECSECRTRYLVPDTAIGTEGRTVRCASCKHSWFQEPAPLDLVARADGVAAAVPQAVSPAQAPSMTRERAASAGIGDSGRDTEWDPFAHRPPFRPRRNPARQRTIAAVAVGTAMLVGVAAILYSGEPGVATQMGLVEPAASPLQIQQYPIDRRDLPTGSELFAVSGKIVNPSKTRQPVPNIRAELRDAPGDNARVVFSWTITPQRRSLAPGESVEFNSAQFDVPPNSKRLDFSFERGPVS